MRELDTLLATYLDRCYQDAAPCERRAFEALLELPDPEIWDFVLGNDAPTDPELRNVIARIANPAAGA
jgi:succinate dehydrogenase flavin-adding protein (antitoxin of CptAB toxin-antitoxin module)